MYSEDRQSGVEVEPIDVEEELLPEAQTALDQFYVKHRLGALEANDSDSGVLYDNFVRAYLSSKGVPSHLYSTFAYPGRQPYYLEDNDIINLDETTGEFKARFTVHSKEVDDQNNRKVLFDSVVKCFVSKEALQKVRDILAEKQANDSKEQEDWEAQTKREFKEFLPFALEHIGESLTPEEWNSHGMPNTVFGTMPENMEWSLEKTPGNKLRIVFWNMYEGGSRGSMRDAYEFELPNQ